MTDTEMWMTNDGTTLSLSAITINIYDGTEFNS